MEEAKTQPMAPIEIERRRADHWKKEEGNKLKCISWDVWVIMLELWSMSYELRIIMFELWYMNYEYKLLIKKSELGICTNFSFSLMLVYICLKFVLFEELCALYRIMLFI